MGKQASPCSNAASCCTQLPGTLLTLSLGDAPPGGLLGLHTTGSGVLNL